MQSNKEIIFHYEYYERLFSHPFLFIFIVKSTCEKLKIITEKRNVLNGKINKNVKEINIMKMENTRLNIISYTNKVR